MSCQLARLVVMVLAGIPVNVMIMMMLMFLQRKRTWAGGSVWPLEIRGDLSI